MSDQPFPTDSTQVIVNDVIDGVYRGALQLAETSIFSEVPFLNLPVIKQLATFIIEGIGNAIYKNFSLFVAFTIIDTQVSGQVSDVTKALTSLKEAQKSGDQNAIQAAINIFNQTIEKLTHLDGSGPSL